MKSNGGVILFDGVCNLCNGFVRFVVERDRVGYFKFASLQSEKGRELLRRFAPEKVDKIDTIVLIEDDKIYFKSTAALRIAKKLNAAWPIAYGLVVIPNFIRNGVYDFIATNRYKWFGRKDECPLPTPDTAKRFIG